MTVRPARNDDLERWLTMRCALWPEGSEAEHRGEIERYLAGAAREPQEVLLACDSEGRAVGFVELSIRPCAEGCRTDRVAYLEGWYVEPGARGTGVAGALVRSAEDWARGQGCVELASDAAPDNEASRRAHLGAGFEDVGFVRCFRKDL